MAGESKPWTKEDWLALGCRVGKSTVIVALSSYLIYKIWKFESPNSACPCPGVCEVKT